ncbi:MAG: dihydrolipoyl dehydrogenase [Oscillospiraceae bacterium]|nr:dihydrolipoyl dehydrogenase [Oscillospiraceae bacterium]
MADYQLLVIGAGPGGYTAALRAAKHGLKTAVVEAREAGGTCVNRGCVPTKTLLHASELYRAVQEGAAFGIHAEGLRADVGRIFAHKREVSRTLSQGVESLLKAAKVPLIRGRAQITAPRTVTVTGPDGEQTVYTAAHILIAAGAAPLRPPIPGIELALTSDDVLESEGTMFRSLAIIGGGVIGVEFACFYADLGCEVTVVEALDRLLPSLDRELGQNLALQLKKQGVRILTNARVQRIAETAEGVSVAVDSKTGAETIAAEAVICAVGRRPCSAGLFAEGLQPDMDGALIRVNERFQTSIPGVYAIGDLSCPVQFAHLAAAQGEAFAALLAGCEPLCDLRLVPSCIHCRPEIAAVGLSEAEAKAAGIPVKVGKCVMGGNARTLVMNPGRSFMKLVAHAETGELLGAQLMCPNASDMISQLGQAIANHLHPRQLLRAMRPHPTFEEALGDALGDLCNKLEKS